AASGIDGINLRGAMLQKAVREPAGGSAQVNGHRAVDLKLEMLQSMFEFQTAPADIFFGSNQGELIHRLHQVARLAGGLPIDGDMAGHDGAARFFATLAQPALNQRLIQPMPRHVEYQYEQLPEAGQQGRCTFPGTIDRAAPARP